MALNAVAEEDSEERDVKVRKGFKTLEHCFVKFSGKGMNVFVTQNHTFHLKSLKLTFSFSFSFDIFYEIPSKEPCLLTILNSFISLILHQVN